MAEVEVSDRGATVAVAANSDGRGVFASIEGRWFSQIGHFPMTLDDVESLVRAARGPRLSYDQLLAQYGGRVQLLAIDR